MNDLKITYIANAGLLISFSEKTILIDGIHFFKPFGFSPVPEKVLNNIINGESLYKDMDYILFTHYHNDHFNENKLADYCLTNSPRLIVAPKSDDNLKNIKANKLYLDSFLWQETIILEDNGIKLSAYKTLHDGKQYQNIEHYIYQINISNINILVMSDTDFRCPELEKMLSNKKIDILIVNFLFLNNSYGRKLIKQINPSELLIYHLPFENEDVNSYIKIAIRDMERYKSEIPKTKLLLKCEETVIFNLYSFN